MGDIPRQGRNLGVPVWQAVAALDEVMGRIPRSEAELQARRSTIESSLRGFQARGIDGEALIRYGFAPRIAITVLAQVLFLRLEDVATTVDLRAWRAALNIGEGLVDGFQDNEPNARALEELTSAVVRVQHALTAWIENASMADLLLLAPPSTDDLDGWALLPSASGPVAEAYTWLWQRSVVHELDRWTTASLIAEFRWQDNEIGASFSDEILVGPRPEKSLLAIEVARRLTRPEAVADEGTERLFWQLQDQASEHLQHQRYTEAIALFEFFHRLHPDHHQALNNLGFCQFPVDPELALHTLRAAERKGYRPLAINVYNQACALLALERLPEAFDRLEYYWQHERADDSALPDGVLWARSRGGWVLEHSAVPLTALCMLGEQIAVTLDRPERAARWVERTDLVATGRSAA